MDINNFISLLGLFVLMAFGWLFSTNRKNLNFKVIIWGVIIQLLMGFFIFIVPAGRELFLFLNHVVIKFLNSAFEGAHFVFGPLALAPGQTAADGSKSIGFILAFQGFPAIIFFSAVISLLYYFKIMPAVIRAFSYVFTKLMKISGAESLAATSNIFVGIESALTIRPYLSNMTQSELCTVLTAGMATIASSVLAAYVVILHGQFPMIAGHLISASFLSAPAALIMSKILMPETAVPETLGVTVIPYYENDGGIFSSVINGANAGVKMIVGIVALLIAVISIVALLNMLFGSCGDLINYIFGTHYNLSFEKLLGYIFYPFTLLLGIPVHDAGQVSGIIGERLILTEVVSYQHLAELLKSGTLTNPRTAVITAYALCGFAHFASMAIFTGGIAAIAPGRIKDLTRAAPRALLAATLACLMTGCIAGIFFSGSSVMFR